MDHLLLPRNHLRSPRFHLFERSQTRHEVTQSAKVTKSPALIPKAICEYIEDAVTAPARLSRLTKVLRQKIQAYAMKVEFEYSHPEM